MSEYKSATDSPATERALQRLNTYIDSGKAQGIDLLRTVSSMVIRPFRVYTKDMSFFPATECGTPPEYFINLPDSDDSNKVVFTLHKNALRQMANEVNIPITFVNTLMNGEAWERSQLSWLLEERFRKLNFKQRGGGSPRFVNLVVGKQVRGFVSRSFKRHLRSLPIFEAFIKACNTFGAMPVEALASDVSFTLRCMLPYAFSISRNQYIAIGISCSNSDFGAGMFKIGLSVMNLQTGAITHLKNLKEERHVGAAEKDDGQSEALSDATVSAKIYATQLEVQDVVSSGLSPDAINKLLDDITDVMDKEISWNKFARYMQGKLTQDEMKEIQEILKDKTKSGEIADIKYDIDEVAIITGWWAANAVATIASKYTGEKKDDLQCAAGALLMGARAPSNAVD